MANSKIVTLYSASGKVLFVYKVNYANFQKAVNEAFAEYLSNAVGPLTSANLNLRIEASKLVHHFDASRLD